MQVFRWSATNPKMFILLWTVIWSQNKLYISNEMGKKEHEKLIWTSKSSRKKNPNIFNKFVSNLTQRQINVSVVIK